MQKKRPIIGVVAAQASDIEQRRILKGTIEQARAENIDIIVISNIYNPDKSTYTLDCKKENNIYDLISSPDIDGFILIAEAIINIDLQERIKSALQKRPETPVVVVGAPKENFLLPHFEIINTDDVSDIEDITDHLIEKHHFSKIDIISGPEELEISHQRIKGYKKSLEKHNIPFNENRVVFGDFWTISGQNLAKEYISGIRPLPQALICANDYMAFGLLDELIESGIRVPEDLTVIGYEHVLQRLYHSPVLTTYQRNRLALGAAAVKILCNKILGKRYRKSGIPKGRFIMGDTCSCGKCKIEYNNELKDVKTEQLYSFYNLFSDFEYRLTECKSMNDYVSALSNFTYMIRGISGMYLCIFEDWYSISGRHDTSVMNCYTIRNDMTGEYKTSFINKADISSILSKYPQSCAYYFNPIFFSDRYFGYIITVYDTPDTYDSIFRNWLKTVSNALEILRIKNDVSHLTQCHSLSENHDSLTGMYNRTGFENAVKRAVSSMPDGSSLILLILKTELFSENIRFEGQETQYKTVQEIANSFKMLTDSKNEMCGRISNSVYVFAGFRKYPEDYCDILTDKLTSMMLHATSYITEYGTNSFVCKAQTYSSENFNFEAAINDLTEKLNFEVEERTERQSFPHYLDFQKLRNKIYLNPSEQYYSDEICQKLCLSTGYFRNIYKKYFDISYHQDCIQSKISMAKYLLCTTSMSITAIASKCGYDDEKYFMRLFQQNTSHTPNKYRMLFHSK